MLLYLDNCCFNRPYDDQSHYRVNLETQAKLYIQDKILGNEYDLIWSYILEFENNQNPYIDKKREIAKWRSIAKVQIGPSEYIVRCANNYQALGLPVKDALHCACASEAKADFFLTTDKALINKASAISKLNVINPLRFIEIEQDMTP